MEPSRDGHLADLTYVELRRDDRQALLRKLPYLGRGWYSKPAAAYLLETGQATWADFKWVPGRHGARGAGCLAQALQKRLAGGEEHMAKLSVNALIGLWARNQDLVYSMRTSNHELDGRGCHWRQTFTDAAGKASSAGAFGTGRLVIEEITQLDSSLWADIAELSLNCKVKFLLLGDFRQLPAVLDAFGPERFPRRGQPDTCLVISHANRMRLNEQHNRRLAPAEAVTLRYEGRTNAPQTMRVWPGLRLVGAGGKVSKGCFVTVAEAGPDAVTLESGERFTHAGCRIGAG